MLNSLENKAQCQRNEGINFKQGADMFCQCQLKTNFVLLFFDASDSDIGLDIHSSSNNNFV